MSNAEEQRDELEALESIYSEEIDILGENPHRCSVNCVRIQYKLQTSVSDPDKTWIRIQERSWDPHFC